MLAVAMYSSGLGGGGSQKYSWFKASEMLMRCAGFSARSLSSKSSATESMLCSDVDKTTRCEHYKKINTTVCVPLGFTGHGTFPWCAAPAHAL